MCNSKWLWLLAAFVLAAVPARATTITYTESNDGGSATLLNITACNASATQDRTLLIKQSGATTGTASPSIAKSAFVADGFSTATGDPNLTSWASGNWVVSLNVITANSNIQWTDTCIYRVDSGFNNVLGTVGTLNGQTLSLGTTGVKSMTISGASQSANATDRIEVLLIFQNTNTHNTQSFSYDLGNSSNDTIATPLVSSAPPCPPGMLLMMGVGCG